MEKITVEDIVKMTKGSLIFGYPKKQVKDISIDSREVKKDYLFVALKGEVTDGHRFLEDAYKNGASALLISDLDEVREYGFDISETRAISVIKVEDTLYALQELARKYYLDMAMDTVAITGSVGKTTTRDMTYAALSARYKCGTNKKNYNSETGFPLTLLSFTSDMEVGVLEMGMDAPGQIERLAELSEPEIGIITNIGISHIERLGSRENIFKAKMELAENFDSENVLIVNWDDDLLKGLGDEALSYSIVKVGEDPDSDYRIEDIKDYGIDGISFTLNSPNESIDINLPISGSHNAINCGLALAAAEIMGVSIKDAVDNISTMETTGSRLRVLERDGIKIIDDSYNAAPASMKSAVSTLANTSGKRRIAVLGGMNELGELSEKEHKEVGKHIAKSGIDLLITVGEMAKWISEGAGKRVKALSFPDRESIYPELDNLFKSGDVILVKASRSYELDQLAEMIYNEGEHK